MLQRIQTIFWLLTIAVTSIYCFQVYDREMDFRNYQQPIFSILSGITIIVLFLCVFSFHRRRRQVAFSIISSLVFILHIGVQAFHHAEHSLLDYIETYALLILALILNHCGTIATKRDIKLLEDSSRLR